MADPFGGDPLGAADALRVEAHQLREAARALAKQALEARANAQRLREQARTAVITAEQLTRLRTELRENVEALASRLRKLGVPPETVVVAVRGISREAAQMTINPLPHADRLALTYDLVRWAVQAYYAA